MTTSNDNERINELRKRRELEAHKARRSENRKIHGARLAASLSSATSAGLSLSDFHENATIPFEVHWPADITKANGLVAAYIAEERARQIVICIDAKLKNISGLIGIYKNDYLGLAKAQEINIKKLLDSCKEIQDSIILYPDNEDGAIILDYYPSPPSSPPFSILIQGNALTKALQECIE